jgi:hypothetical protein
MKKFTLAGIVLIATAMLLLPNLYAQQQASETQQPGSGVEQQSQQGGWYCPWMSLKTQGQGGMAMPGMWPGGRHGRKAS